MAGGVRLSRFITWGRSGEWQEAEDDDAHQNQTLQDIEANAGEVQAGRRGSMAESAERFESAVDAMAPMIMMKDAQIRVVFSQVVANCGTRR